MESEASGEPFNLALWHSAAPGILPWGDSERESRPEEGWALGCENETPGGKRRWAPAPMWASGRWHRDGARRPGLPRARSPHALTAAARTPGLLPPATAVGPLPGPREPLSPPSGLSPAASLTSPTGAGGRGVRSDYGWTDSPQAGVVSPGERGTVGWGTGSRGRRPDQRGHSTLTRNTTPGRTHQCAGSLWATVGEDRVQGGQLS